jgi:hypothetical protein
VRDWAQRCWSKRIGVMHKTISINVRELNNRSFGGILCDDAAKTIIGKIIKFVGPFKFLTDNIT